MDIRKKIVLITSGQPSLNPRLVKEVNSLLKAGFDITVIYQYRNDWGTILDNPIIRDWKVFRVGGDPIHEKASYFLSRLLFKTITILSLKYGLIKSIAELALGRCTLLLIKKAKSIKADMYIAHNLAALPAAVKAAKKNNSKCGFDAEDFHRNEVSDFTDSLDVKLKSHIENKYIPQLNYLSTASPLISEAYQTLFPASNPTTILNVFPKPLILSQSAKKTCLRLFWFSQTIGKGRGLELIIEAIAKLKEFKIELHLLGEHDTLIQTEFEQIVAKHNLEQNFIFYYEPIPPDEIFSFAAQFDIGLATEVSTPKNRDLCLTNKIFTYIQAGLAIIASNTSAQQNLMAQYPNLGLTFEVNSLNSLVNSIRQLAENDQLLINYQQNAVRYSNEKLNWEIEEEKFIALINSNLS